MKSSKALTVRAGKVQRGSRLSPQNTMQFPHALRDAIPGPELPGCDRSLLLSAIEGTCYEGLFGACVRLTFRVQETGKLTGSFDVQAMINVAEARALAATLIELADRVAGEPDNS